MRLGPLVAAMVLAGTTGLVAETAIPPKDVAGSDLPWLKRYAGSLILDYAQSAFDEVDLVAGPLQPREGRDASNNVLRVPEKLVTLQGRRTRWLYLMPEGRSPLEVTAGYGEELAALNAETLFQCRDQACGGKIGNAVDAGGGEQGLIQYVFARDQLPKALYSAGWCVLTASNTGQRYALFKTEAAHVSVFAAQVKASSDCKRFDGRTFAIVTAVENRAREQRMEVVDAKAMAGAIASQGRAVLSGILFDTDKATIKPESKPQLDEIAALLRANPKTAYFVVGHTDNQGSPDYNLDLSRRRSAAIADALQKSYGIAAGRLTGVGVGMVSPVASNADEPGRARNRRVEIVPR